jgi:hypothetical protein
MTILLTGWRGCRRRRPGDAHAVHAEGAVVDLPCCSPYPCGAQPPREGWRQGAHDTAQHGRVMSVQRHVSRHHVRLNTRTPSHTHTHHHHTHTIALGRTMLPPARPLRFLGRLATRQKTRTSPRHLSICLWVLVDSAIRTAACRVRPTGCRLPVMRHPCASTCSLSRRLLGRLSPFAFFPVLAMDVINTDLCTAQRHLIALQRIHHGTVSVCVCLCVSVCDSTLVSANILHLTCWPCCRVISLCCCRR